MEPQHAAMTVEVNQHILNFKPSASTPTRNEPYKLTFYVENDTYTKQQPQHHIDSRNHVKQQSYNNYYDEVVMESYESPEMYSNKVAQAQRSKHESYCILSAFLYFVTITTFTYLVVLWIKQRMHMHMEVLHWW
ncbi:slit [Holotrichia oblita]|uniref:Slit n=1 Tax=Holotrichia oblita TaxID=644536 RepID=A0ACB9SS73_HOLOL|nr:slit [Holotrichia oblita]